MKRTLIAAAAVLAAGGAFAQSSVQLYGRVNTSVERQKAGGTSTTVMQDNNSRWGLRGSEDLGSGLKALFVLESGFASDTGALNTGYGSGRLFQRESWVGVESASFGRVRLGNMGQTAAYYATADYISMHNHDTGTSSDALYLVPGQKQNTISYNTPSFGGLVLEAQYGMKQDAANNEIRYGRSTNVVAANFDRGPLHLGLSWVNAPLVLAPASVLAVGDQHGKEIGARALYEIGPVTVGAYYVRNNVISGIGGGEAKRNAYRVSAMYTLGASEFHVNVGYADRYKLSGATLAANNGAALQYTLAYNYNLSKRTKVYAFYTKVDNRDGANYSNIGGNTAGSDPSSVAIGVRHNF